MIKTSIRTLLLVVAASAGCYGQVYLDPAQPLDARVNDLISRLSLEEKVQQMMNATPAVPRLNIPPYDWWNESLHGVARSGVATVFLQAIGLGATFDEDLIFRISSAISDEARAMYNAAMEKDYHKRYGGLTFWTPNINIFRDPRWGRGQETYGEDPYLTARLGTAYVKGLQGNDPVYLKAAACAKHYAVHSGPERLRHEFDAITSAKDLHETYLPAFKALVDAGVEAVMCAYNRTNGEPCCSSNTLLTDILRNQWGFKGHIVSDCGAVADLYTGHKVVGTEAEAAALAVKSGVGLDCGTEYNALLDAVKQGLITEAEIDRELAILLRTRFRLGMFDPKGKNPYDRITSDVINSEAHRKLAREAALKSIVLLKNDGVLPLRNDLANYFITGPNAASVEALIGNYYGVNPEMVTIMEGIAAAIEPGSQLQYRHGILLDRPNANPIDWTTGNTKISDANFVVLGITGLLEGEEGAAIASPHFGDRLDYNLPQNQIDFLRKICTDNDRPVIAIITGGSPMNLAEVHELADAVLLVWYPGEEGGNAVADVIFGKASPSGRLPITFPKSFDQLPAYDDYNMEGRTYRYMKEEPLYPFGFGLSYSTFEYSGATLSRDMLRRRGKENVTIKATVTNTGKYAAEEVVQLYITDEASRYRVPLFTLSGIKRVHLEPGQSAEVEFEITPDMLAVVTDTGEKVLEPGRFTISVAGSLPGKRSSDLGINPPVHAILTVR
ncbi:MAG: glycoside hydrolase family 3 C-terminal domain-containing protein [Cyclobacteriaceae bacterium]|nr:glycoside hydrolase family 3 C-terminal domain-containing protein [Cyclobacteriaceae bacterium]